MSVGLSAAVDTSKRERGQTPAWRYYRACDELKKDMSGLQDYIPSDDVALIALKRLLKADMDKTIPAARRRAAAPMAYKLLDLFYNDTAESARYFLEAALLGGADPQYISDNLDLELSADEVKMFKLWFFDIDGRLTKPFWVLEHVFKPYSMLDDNRRDSAFMWKVYAYAGGLSVFEELARGDKSLTKITLEWVKRRSSDQVARELLKLVHDSAKVTKRTQYALQQAMQLKWLEADAAVEKAAPAIKAVADTCASKIRQVLDAYPSAEQLDATEVIPESILNLK